MVFKWWQCVGYLAVGFLCVTGCNTDKTSPEDSQKASVSVLVNPVASRKLAVVSPEFLALENERARQGKHGSNIVFAEKGAGVAYVEPVQGKFRVVHNGQAGKTYVSISQLIISSDGKRVAYVATNDKKTYSMFVDGRKGPEFGWDSNHYFTPDGRHHVSTVMDGDDKYIAIDGKVSRDLRIVQSPVFSADSRFLAFSVGPADGKGIQFVISDMKLKNRKVFDSCGEFILPSDDRSRLAVGCLKGGENTIKVIDFIGQRAISESMVNGDITYMKFSPYNNMLAYTVIRPELQRYIVYDGREEKTPAGDEFFSNPVALTGPEGVGVIIGTVYKAYLYRAFQKENKIGKGYGYISDLVSGKDGRHHAYIATDVNDTKMHIVVDGFEGPKFDKIVSPVFSHDSRSLVYRARQSGKRFVVVSDLKGEIVRKHPEYEMVFPVEFADDGTAVGYGVLDGDEFWWKVEKL